VSTHILKLFDIELLVKLDTETGTRTYCAQTANGFSSGWHVSVEIALVGLVESQMQAPAVEPVCFTKPTVSSFAALIANFDQAAQASYEAIPENPYRDAIPAEHAAPLLAFVEGVLRWFIRNDLHHIDGRTNPWYAMGLALGSRYGIDEPMQVARFGLSHMDDLVAVDPLPGAQVTAFSGHIRSDGTSN